LVYFYRWATDTAYRPYSLCALQTYCRQQKGRRSGKAYRTFVLSAPALPNDACCCRGAEIEHDVVGNVYLIRQLRIILRAGHPLGFWWATGLSSDNIGFCSFLSPGLLAAYPQYLASVCAGFGTKRACRASLELGHGGPTAPQPRQRAWQPNSVNTTVIEQRRWSHPAPKLGPQLVRDLSTNAILPPPF
jgi:hypothetical protein